MVQYLTESDALDPLIERIKTAGISSASRKGGRPYGAGMLRAGNATICLTDGRTATQIAFGGGRPDQRADARPGA